MTKAELAAQVHALKNELHAAREKHGACGGVLKEAMLSISYARAEGFAAGVAAAAKWCEENTWDTEAELYEGLRALSPPGREG